MITINQSAMILNKGGRKYDTKEAESIRDYLYQMAELEYRIGSAVFNNNTIIISKWSELSSGYYKCIDMINEIRRRGIKIIANDEPINFRSAYWQTQLIQYLIYLPI